MGAFKVQSQFNMNCVRVYGILMSIALVLACTISTLFRNLFDGFVIVRNED